MRKRKRRRAPTKESPALQMYFGGESAVLLSVSGWLAIPLLVLSYFVGHAMFIFLTRLLCRERDGNGLVVWAPRHVSAFGDYALIRKVSGYRHIAVHRALTQAQRQVFISGRVHIQ